MHWQDIAVSAAQWVSIGALFPMVMAHEKPALSSSLLTAGCCAVYAFCFLTLSLWISAASSAFLTLTWLLLAWQKWRGGMVK